MTKKLDKGTSLERTAHQFLWDLGYIVFPRMKIYATRLTGTNRINKIKVTDLDCFGIKFGAYLEIHRFLIDCKHRSENIFSQILKSKGLASIMKINTLLLIRESVPETAQQFAETFDIRLVSKSQFIKDIKPRERGSFSSKSYLLVDQISKQISGKLGNIKVQLSNTFIEPDPFKRLKELRGYYNELKPLIKSEAKEIQAEHLLMFHVFLFTAITLAQIASQTIHLSKYHFSNYLLTKLIGDIASKMEFFQILKDLEGDEGPLIKDLKDIAPTYTDSVIQIVNAMRRSSDIVNEYLRYNDFIIHEFGIFSGKISKRLVEDEIWEISTETISKWNRYCIAVLDEEKTPPIFLAKLLL